MRVVLRVTSGQYKGRAMLLRPGEVIKVGRTDWSDFAVPHDSHMSSQHFQVECGRNEHCWLSDLSSTNGTFVNNERVMKVELANGDVIRAGATDFAIAVEREAESLSGSSAILAPPPASTSPAALVTIADQPMSWMGDYLIPSGAGLPYVQGLNDPDPQVRREALLVAAWTGQRWLREYLRLRASDPRAESWEFLRIFAVLAQPSDLERIVLLGRTLSLGSRRFQLFASYGHPRIVRDLLVGIESKDPPIAVAAGNAFTRITGADIDSEQRVELPPEDGQEVDDFEKDFLPVVFLPDPRRAREHWNSVHKRYEQGIRWRCGLEVTQPFASGVIDQLDMEGRWEAYLRGRFDGLWSGSLRQVLSS